MAFTVVTGAASGMGRAIRDRLVAEGRDVLGVDRSELTDGRSVQCDLRDADAIDALTAGWTENPPAALVNCAGLSGHAPAADVFAVNVLAARRLTDAFLAASPAAGAIVQIASGVGTGWRERAAALAAIVQLDDQAALDAAVALAGETGDAYKLSKELICCHASLTAGRIARSGRRINCVMPGPVDTPMMPGFRATMGDDRINWILDTRGRFGRSEEIAPAVSFLLSEDAGWINGAELLVDGGLMAMAGGRLRDAKAAG